MAEVVEAWIVTMDRQAGIFDRSFDQQGIKQAHNMGDSEALADDSLIEVVSDIDDLQAHHLWINFLLETWQARSSARGKKRLLLIIIRDLLVSATFMAYHLPLRVCVLSIDTKESHK